MLPTATDVDLFGHQRPADDVIVPEVPPAFWRNIRGGRGDTRGRPARGVQGQPLALRRGDGPEGAMSRSGRGPGQH